MGSPSESNSCLHFTSVLRTGPGSEGGGGSVTFRSGAGRNNTLRNPPSATAFHEKATWATLAEIRLMARIAGLEEADVNGSYAGEPYGARSRETLVVLERP